MLGENFLTNDSGVCKVLEVVTFRKVLVEFEDGYRKYCRPDALKLGSVKNPFYPSLFGVGYMGEGNYNSNNSRLAHKKWIGMLTRCYGEKYLEKQPTYIDVEVCKEWLCFQNFAAWCETQDSFGKPDINGNSFVLDKDLFHDGRKRRYSPETCCFIPNFLNGMIVVRNSKDYLPLGIYKKGHRFVFRSKNYMRERVTYISYSIEDVVAFHSNFRKQMFIDFLNDKNQKICDRVRMKLEEIVACWI